LGLLFYTSWNWHWQDGVYGRSFGEIVIWAGRRDKSKD
jgi:hypothetical protein